MKMFKIMLPVIILLMITLSYGEDTGGRYLIISDLKLAPNPFTPYSVFTDLIEQDDGEGLRISFRVESQARFVWITVGIFDVRGNLVRKITELEPVYSSKGPGDVGESADIILWWDGKTDFERMAPNGRYVIHLKVSDSEAENFYREKMATVVLVK